MKPSSLVLLSQSVAHEGTTEASERLLDEEMPTTRAGPNHGMDYEALAQPPLSLLIRREEAAFTNTISAWQRHM